MPEYRRAQFNREAEKEIAMEDDIDQEEKQEIQEQKMQRAEDVVEKLYGELFDEGVDPPISVIACQNDSTVLELLDANRDIQTEIFDIWFKKNPNDCVAALRFFNSLEDRVQYELGQFVYQRFEVDQKSWEIICNELPESFFSQALEVFSVISDVYLRKSIIDYLLVCNPGYLIEHRDTFPDIDSSKIFLRLGYINYHDHKLINWARIIPYLDFFTHIQPKDAVVGCLIQWLNGNPEIILKNKNKILLPEKEIIDLFFEHNRSFYLIRNIQYIDPAYHQYVIDGILREKSYDQDGMLLKTLNEIKGVDSAGLVKEIAEREYSVKGKDPKKGTSLIAVDIRGISGEILSHLGEDTIAEMVENYPDSLLACYDEKMHGNVLDVSTLFDRCLDKKKFHTVISQKEKFKGDNNTLALKLLEAGFKELSFNLHNFFHLSLEVFDKLLSEPIDKTLLFTHLNSFDAIDETRIRTLVERGGAVQVAAANFPIQVKEALKSKYGQITVDLEEILHRLIKAKIWPDISREDILFTVNKEELKKRGLYCFSPEEVYLLLREDAPGKKSYQEEEDYAKAFLIFKKEKKGEWQYDETVRWCESAVLGTDESPAWASHKQLFRYLGNNSSLHDGLNMMPHFLEIMQQVSLSDSECRAYVSRMFDAAGTGNGNQATIFRDIMNGISESIWKKLRQESVYPGQPPALSDLGNINLQRIKNEIRLINMPEIRGAIEHLPKEKGQLQQYVIRLIEHPTINVDAVHAFIQNPGGFFASRTGAGEQGPITGSILDAMDPKQYPYWSAEESRDAIVEGAYDRLNVFPFERYTWSQNQQFTQAKADIEKNVLESTSPVPTFDYLRHLEKYSKKGAENTQEQVRNNLFCGVLEDRFDQTRDFLNTNAPIVLEKSFAFKEKRYTSYIDGLITKKETSTFDGDKASVAILKQEREKIVLAILEEKKRTEIFLAQAMVGDKNAAQQFWQVICGTEWLTKMDLGNFLKRITKADLGDERTALESASRKDMIFRLGLASFLSHIRQTTETEYFDIEILKPSDPETATAGSTTGNCDAFGHGKKAHFMVNPGVAQLVLRSKKARGEESVDWQEQDIIAQSTVTSDTLVFDTADQRKNFYKVFSETGGKFGPAIQHAFGEGYDARAFLKKHILGEKQICLDSVEVPPNTRDKFSPKKIFDLLQEGLVGLGQKDPFYKKRAVVGTSYSYLGESGLPITENRGTWVTPLAYSDNTGEDAVLLQPDHEERKKEQPGIRNMQPSDVLSVGIMEDIAFTRSGGAGYITGFFHMAREVYASCLQREHRGLPPLAFVHASEKEGSVMPDGYLIAYETDRDTIYITDTATTGEEKGVGTKLIMSLLESVGKSTKTNGKKITMDCRGETSARALVNPKAKKFIESFSCVDETGATVSFLLSGPKEEDIHGDGLYHFEISPRVMKT